MKDPPRIPMKPRQTAEEWAEGIEPAPKKSTGDVKRVTVDLPIEIHQKLKIRCVMERVNIADMVRKWIEEKLNE
jgi:ParG protein